MDNTDTQIFKLESPVNGVTQDLTSVSLGLVLFTPIPFKNYVSAISTLFTAYLTITPQSVFKWQNLGGVSDSFKPIDGKAFETIKEKLEGNYHKTCSIWLKDGSTVTDVGENLLTIFGSDQANSVNDSNYIRMTFPLNAVQDSKREKFIDGIHAMVKGLPFYSGYLGYFLNTSTLAQVAPYDDLISNKSFELAQTFPGLEITKPHLENYEMKEHLRPASWITFISHEFCRKLGGVEHIRNTLSGDFMIRQLDHGWSVQAGSIPHIRNVSTEQKLLARVLSPLYSKEPAFLYPNKGHEETLRWMGRLNSQL